MEKTDRHYELKLSYRYAGSFTVERVDTILADNLVSLIAQFVVLIGSLHRAILTELEAEEGPKVDDDIPF